jgi:predicted RNA-binding protein with PUA-like domain
MNRWWSHEPTERYWLEATDREDIGADLRAPETDESGQDNWRYSLFKDAQVGDVVLHYDKRPSSNGIVGWSLVSDRPFAAPIVWAARGTYARDKGINPRERPGFVVPLSDFHKLPAPVTLDQIRSMEDRLRALMAELERDYGKPLYFPFELSNKRPIRLLQGYAFKLPRRFLQSFPGLEAIIHQALESARQIDVSRHRNPPWTRDELILALELYLRNPTSPPGKESRAVIELSELLNKLGRVLGQRDDETFRNANGVYMKMMNFRRFDRDYTSAGKVGLTRGNKDEEAVWQEFSQDRERLVRVADAIRQAILLPADVQNPTDDEEGTVEAEEGRLLTRLPRAKPKARRTAQAKSACRIWPPLL